MSPVVGRHPAIPFVRPIFGPQVLLPDVVDVVLVQLLPTRYRQEHPRTPAYLEAVYAACSTGYFDADDYDPLILNPDVFTDDTPTYLPREEKRLAEAVVATLVQQDPADVPSAVKREADQAKDAIA